MWVGSFKLNRFNARISIEEGIQKGPITCKKPIRLHKNRSIIDIDI